MVSVVRQNRYLNDRRQYVSFGGSFNEDDKFNNESHSFLLKVKITVGRGQTWPCVRHVKARYSVENYILSAIMNAWQWEEKAIFIHQYAS